MRELIKKKEGDEDLNQDDSFSLQEADALTLERRVRVDRVT